MNNPEEPMDPWDKAPANLPGGAPAEVSAKTPGEAPGAGGDAPEAPEQTPEAPGEKPEAAEEPPEAAEPAEDAVTAAKSRRRRKLIRLASWLLIGAGIIIIPGYYLSTCAYTAIQQRGLRNELATQNPQLAETEATLTAADYTRMQLEAEKAAVEAADAAQKAAAQAALEAAEAQRRAELAKFKEAADAFALTVLPGEALGRIVIPKIGVDVVMVEGVGKSFLKEGPGHWPETPFPGQIANFVVSGHRTTYGAPFFKLNELEPGDEIQLIMPYVIAKYTVTEVIIVSPTELDQVKQLGREQVSLAACHPIYSAKQRIVAKGDLTSFVLVDQDGADQNAATQEGPQN
jgi:LPXTG-site transpeptidase (sortase) family protein